MSHDRDDRYLAGLLEELCALPRETSWLEFKVNNVDPREIGEYVSALSNAAALAGRPSGFLIWGVEDGTQRVVGTTFVSAVAKKGNEPLETWLLRQLNPKLGFRFYDVVRDDLRVVILEIDRAVRHPTRFGADAFVRIGSVKKPLREAPELERELWRVLDQTPFENLIAVERASDSQVCALLDHGSYFELLGAASPSSESGIVDALARDGLLERCEAGGWNITNLGATLLARHLSDFAALGRKAMRVVRYRGRSRLETVEEYLEPSGYACSFARLVSRVNDLSPSNEVVGEALRRTASVFPALAVRELVANALIHQDLMVRGSGPMVEIFDDRMEITNPGRPLVETERFVDTPPRSRNEALASLMRRFGVCEERGSGIDKVIFQIEYHQLPAPLFEVVDGSTRTVLFAPRPLRSMDKADRVRACYLHACLRFVMRDYLTNSSLRERFGVEERNKATVSRYIREAVEEGRIRPHDEGASKRLMKYVPYWAGS